MAKNDEIIQALQVMPAVLYERFREYGQVKKFLPSCLFFPTPLPPFVSLLYAFLWRRN